MTKIGRNDPCWCGSGSKFKLCHWPTRSPAAKGAATPPPPLPAKMEIAKILKALDDGALLPKDQIATLLGNLAPEHFHEQVHAAVAGLAEEDEFALVCRSLGTTSHLIPLGQKPLVPGHDIPPDFLARFQPGLPIASVGREHSRGFRCLVDVKSTDKAEYVLRGGELRRRLNFARNFGLPLLVAVRFKSFQRNSLWAIVDAEAHGPGPLRVDPGAIGNGLRTVLWEDCLYAIPSASVVRFFDKDGPPDLPRHHDYGALTAIRVYAGHTAYNVAPEVAALYDVLLDAFGLVVEDTKATGSRTEQILRSPLPLANASMPDLVMSLHRGFGLRPGATLTRPGLPVLDRDFVVRLLLPLVQAQVAFKFGLGDPEQLRLTWVKCGGDPASLPAIGGAPEGGTGDTARP